MILLLKINNVYIISIILSCTCMYLFQLYDMIIFILGPYGPSNNYRSQQPNMQVPNDLVLKLMEAQQVINFFTRNNKITYFLIYFILFMS